MVSFLYCLFFFKQKTAYEMRISDWSSDVCSSDLFLIEQFRLGLADIEAGDRIGTTDLRIAENAARYQIMIGAGRGIQDAALKKGRRIGENQIGRASCRERVCQYV